MKRIACFAVLLLSGCALEARSPFVFHRACPYPTVPAVAPSTTYQRPYYPRYQPVPPPPQQQAPLQRIERLPPTNVPAAQTTAQCVTA